MCWTIATGNKAAQTTNDEQRNEDAHLSKEKGRETFSDRGPKKDGRENDLCPIIQHKRQEKKCW